ncbi:MAG: hypothetical protein ABIG61_09740 [Planctomycetota bacterium]
MRDFTIALVQHNSPVGPSVNYLVKLAAESRSRDIRDEMLVINLKGKMVHQRRRRPCFNLQTRRPEVFRVLCEPMP